MILLVAGIVHLNVHIFGAYTKQLIQPRGTERKQRQSLVLKTTTTTTTITSKLQRTYLANQW